MLHLRLLVFVLFPFLVWAQVDIGYWVAKPSDGELTIIGVSNLRLRRDMEIESARDDAVRKLFFYHGITGTIRTNLVSEPGDLQAKVETTLEPRFEGDYDILKESLIFNPERDVVRTDSAVFVRFTCPEPGAKSLNYEATVFANGKPLWLRRTVPIDGYITGVGFSGPQRYLKDTIIKSYESAAAALVVSLSAKIEALDRDGKDSGTNFRITETAQEELTGFMVLEIWIDPKTKAVWTLAAARGK